MLHARVVQPRGAGANTSVNDQPVSVDANSISHIPGAKVVQIGNWIAVVAPKEYDAIQAAAQLKVTWKSDPKLPGSGNFWGWLRKVGDTNTDNPARYTTLQGNVDTALQGRGEDRLGDVQVPLQRLHADRPARRGRRRRREGEPRRRSTSRHRRSTAFRRTSPA